MGAAPDDSLTAAEPASVTRQRCRAARRTGRLRYPRRGACGRPPHDRLPDHADIGLRITVALSPRAWGALAVVGLVVAFSLSSTLVKSAESPGVLVAFWRLATVSVLWNVYLRSTGRRVTLRHVRQAFIPGVFFGVNLATFFVGATNNSVANAALIGSSHRS